MRRALTVATLFVLITSVLQVTPAEARRSCRCHRRRCPPIICRATTPNYVDVTCLSMQPRTAVATGTVTEDPGTTTDGGYYLVLQRTEPDPGSPPPGSATSFTI